MRVTSLSGRGLAALVVLVATLLPVSVRERRAAVHAPVACTNSSCQCSVHEPGVPCGCDASGSPAGGPSLDGGCCSRPEDPVAPQAARPSILPLAPAVPGLLPSGILSRIAVARPVTEGGHSPDPVPKSCA